ncbi:MAG TPA: T9SS type A sorting domain-containing protein [Flavobacteriales bacterium]|nr:T9SS type A sorting domain-containing protein [Flavobacteriales bacterium]HIO67841.1 T9SS type A sorting domain-containing protein [Flavobacteriales bacterium]
MKKLLLVTAVLTTATLSNAQTDIADARTFALGSTVTVTGIVTSGSELGVIRYIQDGSAGIACYPGTGSIAFTPNRGDSITVTGSLKDYNGLLEIDPITSFTTISTGNTLPVPQVITPLQMDETNEGELVQIDDVIFAAGCSNFLGNTAYSFTSNGESGNSYVRTESPLVGGLVPIGAISLVGISSQFTFSSPANDGYQILPRDAADLGAGSTFSFTSCVVQTNITSTGFDLSWSTDSLGSTNIRYGLTSSLELGDINQGGNNTSHSLSLTALSPATFYYVIAYTVSGTDTAFSGVDLFGTTSNSSGDIKVYFNNSVDTSVASGTYAIELNGTFNDTISAYIGRAQYTIDLAIYNNSNAMIVDSINAAYDRGVKIRYVSESAVANTELGNMDTGIGYIERVNTGGSGIMHNKFIVIDRDDTDNSYVLTGSTNFTTTNLFNDYNNLIIIQDQAVAKAFTLEFEEMFGDTGLTPNSSNARFGPDKLDNTPHNFIVGGNPMEVYFSPSDQTTSHIVEAMDNTDYSLYFCILSFTKNEIGDAVQAANDKFGVDVKGVMESINDQGEEYTELIANGVDIQSHQGVTYQIHHKYGIIDQGVSAADPMVFTGSHNWSSAAENNNDENTVFVHDEVIANQYYQEFIARYCELSTPCGSQPPGMDEYAPRTSFNIYPNPNAGVYQVEFTLAQAKEANIRVMDMTAKVVHTETFEANTGDNVIVINDDLNAGQYIFELTIDGVASFLPLIIE